jgi:hypothetical protein
MTKKCLISLIGAIIFALPLVVRGANLPFTENFDTYQNSTSVDRATDLWQSDCGKSRWWVSADDHSSGLQSLQHTIWRAGCDDAYRIGEQVENGKLALDFKFAISSDNNFSIIVENNYLGPGFQKFVYASDFSLNVWHTLFLEWQSYYHQWRWQVDTSGWTAWTTTTDWGTSLNTIRFLGYNTAEGSYTYIDNIRYATNYEAIISPDSPVNCQQNTGTNFNNVLVSGKVEIPSENTRTFTNLIARFQDASTTIILYDWNFALPNLTAGQSHDYSATGSMPTSTYRVSYILSGFTADLKPFTQYEFCQGTYLCDTSCNPQIISELPGYGVPTLDDCSALSGTEKWLCEIKNLIAGIFVPSTSTLGELKSNIDQLQDKAPMNYLKESQDFFTDLKNQSSTTNSLTLTILGQTGDVSFAFWEKTGEISGVQFSFRTIFYNFFCFVVIVIFGFWAIGYMRRIFK